MSIPLRRIVIAMILVLPGCVLLPGRRSDRSRPTQSVNRNRVTRNTVELDVVAIERAVADPLSTQLMWDDLDESGVFDPPVRKALNQNGFRIGVAGSQLPDSIQGVGRCIASSQSAMG